MEPEIFQKHKVELNGKWLNAIICRIHKDLPLAQLQFDDLVRYEWMFTGSPRFDAIWLKLIKKRYMDQVYNFNDEVEDLCDDDDDDGGIRPIPMQIDNIASEQQADDAISYVKHVCGEQCIDRQKEAAISAESLFRRSKAVGFKRIKDTLNGKIYYKAPCGRDLRCYSKIEEYLTQTGCSKLQIDAFTFVKKFDEKDDDYVQGRNVREVCSIRNSSKFTVQHFLTVADRVFIWSDEKRLLWEYLVWFRSNQICPDLFSLITQCCIFRVG